MLLTIYKFTGSLNKRHIWPSKSHCTGATVISLCCAKAIVKNPCLVHGLAICICFKDRAYIKRSLNALVQQRVCIAYVHVLDAHVPYRYQPMANAVHSVYKRFVNVKIFMRLTSLVGYRLRDKRPFKWVSHQAAVFVLIAQEIQ